MIMRVFKRAFYTKSRYLVDRMKSFVDGKLGTLSFKLGNKIKDTYTSDERLEKHRKAMETIKTLAPKNGFEPCYYGDTEENYHWNNDEEEPYDYGIGFNYMSDEEYDEANGIQQEDEPEKGFKTDTLDLSTANLQVAIDKLSEIMLISQLGKYYKSDEGLKPTVKNGGNQPL